MKKTILPHPGAKEYYKGLEPLITGDYSKKDLSNMDPSDRDIIVKEGLKKVDNNPNARMYTSSELDKMSASLLSKVVKYLMLKVVNKNTIEWMDEYYTLIEKNDEKVVTNIL